MTDAEGSPAGGPADEPLADRLEARPVLRSEVVHHGMVWDVVRERVDLGGDAAAGTYAAVDPPALLSFGWGQEGGGPHGAGSGGEGKSNPR